MRLDLAGPAGRLEALLDGGTDRTARRGRLRPSAPDVRRHDAHAGRLSGGEGPDAHRLQRAAVQLPRRRPERRRRSIRARARWRITAPRSTSWPLAIRARRSGPPASRSDRGSRSKPDRPTRACPRSSASRRRSKREGYEWPRTLETEKPKFFVQGDMDELCPIKALWAFYAQLKEPKELAVIEGASHLFDGRTRGSRRGAGRSAGRL